MSFSDNEIFSAEKEFLQARKTIAKEGRTLHDRLSSIHADAKFVERVIDCYGLPAVCNERCGRWYIPTERIAGSVYFKSTDGHTDHCKFSLRRLNIHVLQLVGTYGGLIIVDSTRRGKRMPDALSKTVPIWCCVLNRAAHRLRERGWTSADLELMTPGKVVSPNEGSKIAAQIDGFVTELLAHGLEPALLDGLEKPLRPLWVTPESTVTKVADRFRDAPFLPVVLVTASRSVPDGVERQAGFTYCQGAADDEEMWSAGLQPDLFWRHAEELLRDPATCEPLAQRLVQERRDTGEAARANLPGPAVRHRIPGTDIYLADAVAAEDLRAGGVAIVDLSLRAQLQPETGDEAGARRYLHLPVESGKRGVGQLARAFGAVDALLANLPDPLAALVVTDDGGCRSKAATVALLAMCRRAGGGVVDKHAVRAHLMTLVNTRPGLDPSRAALQRLNAHLLSGAYRPAARSG